MGEIGLTLNFSKCDEVKSHMKTCKFPSPWNCFTVTPLWQQVSLSLSGKTLAAESPI